MADTTYTVASSYTVNTFDYNQATSGKLVAVVGTSITNGSTVPHTPVPGETGYYEFMGTGIVRVISSNGLIVIINSVTYEFDRGGNGRSTSAANLKLMLATVQGTNTEYGTAIPTTTIVNITRGGTGDLNEDVTTGVDSSIVIDALNARDNFAVQAMQAMMQHIQDPSVLSDNEVNMYCQAAYQWAANMMTQAAKARATLTNESGSTGNTPVQADELISNTEKLLNNMIVVQKDALTAQEKTIYTTYWNKDGNAPVYGAYTNAVAQTLPHGSSPAYSDIDDAEDDGWSWTNTQTVTVKGNSTYSDGGTDIHDVLKVQIVAGGGGGGGASALSGLSDVAISSPATGQTLVYNSTSLKWENGKAKDMEITTINTFTNNLQPGHYYYYSPQVSDAVNIWLPTFATTPTEVQIIMVTFTVGSATPAINVAPSATSDLTPVKWRDTKLTSLEASTTYEIDIIHNGTYWIVGATKIVS